MKHPFKMLLYDLVEEFTTFTEWSILLLGILVNYRTNTGVDIPWIEPVTWVILGISFVLVVFVTFIDALNHFNLRWIRRLRAKAGLKISPAIFDLQFSDYLIPRF